MGVVMPSKKETISYLTMLCYDHNKSQEHSPNKVGLYLHEQVFTHGHLYVPFSRVRKRDGLQVMVNDEDNNKDVRVKNIIYKEFF